MNLDLPTRVLLGRALFNGVGLIGHRDSVSQGQMIWAIPGGSTASSHELRTRGTFEKLAGPSDFEIKQYSEKGSKP
jgi:hypothetical protein